MSISGIISCIIGWKEQVRVILAAHHKVIQSYVRADHLADENVQSA